MADILHRVGIKASRDAVTRALATRDGLAAWWTNETRGDSEVDGILEFRFTPNGGFDMKVFELEPGNRVLWKVVDGPKEWIGTKIRFDLREEDGYTIVNFKHEGWKEPVEFMHHCSTMWAVFLLSLKSLVESGQGAPHPRDVKIDNWN